MAGDLFVNACAAVLLTVAISGCTSAPESPSLTSVFGKASVIPVDGKLAVAGPVLEAKLGEGAWAASPAPIMVDVPKISIPKQQPTGAGGGGVTRLLEVTGVASTLQVRFLEKYDLAGFKVEWAVLDGKGAASNWSAPMDPEAVFEAPITNAGGTTVKVQIVHANGTKTAVQTGVTGAVNVKWVIDSAVWPVGGPGPSQPPNYNDMADRFQFKLQTNGGKVDLETQYRQGQPTETGFDVDLELKDPAGKTVAITQSTDCAGSGGLSPPNPSEFANEKGAFAKLTSGMWTAVVGGVSCPNSSFANSGMVPYTATISLDFGPQDAAESD